MNTDKSNFFGMFEDLQTNSKINFWIMDCSVSILVAMSAYFSQTFIRRNGSSSDAQKSIIKVPEGFYGDQLTSTKTWMPSSSSLPFGRNPYLYYAVCTGLYFLAMTVSVISMSRSPAVMVYVQHVAVFSVILLYVRQFCKVPVAIPLAILLSMLWLLSADTSYRWIVNNVIVAMCTMLTGYIEFQNFAYLQIFMWFAFIYDVYMLAGIQLGTSSSLSFMFSFDSSSENRPYQVMTSEGGEICQNLLCALFHHNNNYELPTVFSVQLGHRNSFVYIGTGDIIIGAFVANFTLAFFKTTRHLCITVMGFGLSVGMLSYVTETPFPALLSIVPLCTVAVLISAISCKRTLELLLDSCAEKPLQVDTRTKELLMV